MGIKPEIWHRFSSEFTLSIPATEAQIVEAEAAFGIRLPEQYREFLAKTNGAEGPIGGNEYVALWPVDQLKKLNDAYEVLTYAPDYLVIGSNGGGEAYAFDLRSDSYSISALPFIGLSRDLGKIMGESFWDFLERLWES
jgi:hypothetical protein